MKAKQRRNVATGSITQAASNYNPRWVIFWSGGINAHSSRVSVHQQGTSNCWDPVSFSTPYLPSTSQAKACKSLLGFPYSKLASGCHRGLTWLCTKSLFLLRLSKQTFQMSDGECDFFCFFRCCWTRCVCASGRQEGTVSRRVKWHEKVETGQRETRRWRISFLFF